jgi:hypothetical protein
MLQNLRRGLWALRQNSTFTTAVVLTLALGIGANIVSYSLVSVVLFRPLPCKDPDRLVIIWETNHQQSKYHEEPAPGNFIDWMEQNKVFDGVTGWFKSQVTVQDDNNPEVVTAAQEDQSCEIEEIS